MNQKINDESSSNNVFCSCVPSYDLYRFSVKPLITTKNEK